MAKTFTPGEILTAPDVNEFLVNNQVVQAVSTTQVAITSTAFQDTGLSATITPKSLSNKILVLVNQAYNFSGNRDNLSCFVRIVRGSTNIYTQGPDFGSGFFAGGVAAIESRGILAYSFLDSPSTTGAITYKTQFRLTTTAQNSTSLVQPGGSPSFITLLEVTA